MSQLTKHQRKVILLTMAYGVSAKGAKRKLKEHRVKARLAAREVKAVQRKLLGDGYVTTH